MFRSRHYFFPFLFFTCLSVVTLLCSSGYKDILFIPFIFHFIQYSGSPWEFVRLHHLPWEFPYPPLMLYILSAFLFPFEFFHFSSYWWIENLVFKIPILLSIAFIMYLLMQFFPNQKRKVFWLVISSPILIYSGLVHSQLDAIPMAILLGSLYLCVRKYYGTAGIVFGLALSTKIHVLVALPIMAWYTYQKSGLNKTLQLICPPLLVFLLFSLPYIFFPAYLQDVILNNKQSLIYDSFIQVVDLKIYLPIAVILAIFFRFFCYPKVNTDFLFTYLALVFSVFLIFIKPSPGWYVWIVPFVFYYLLRNLSKLTMISYLFLNVSYLFYFLFFHPYDYPNLIIATHRVDLIIDNIKMRNLAFTILEVSLASMIYTIYTIGLKSNWVYKKDSRFAIGVSGDSATGKTTLVASLHKLLGNRLLKIEGDGDHKWERYHEMWSQLTHLDPKANLLHRQAEHIAKLKTGHTIFRRNYDHHSGKFTNLKKMKAKEFLVLSGLHSFYLPKLRKMFDLKIYMDPDESLRQYWKILRDSQNRGYSVNKALRQIDSRTEDAKKYIYPQKTFVDLIIQFFSLKPVDSSQPKMGLKIIIDASLYLEELLFFLREKNLPVMWDYTEDLQKQQIVLEEEPGINFSDISSKLIENLDELVDQPDWEKGYAGFIQLIIMMLISERLRSNYVSK